MCELTNVKAENRDMFFITAKRFPPFSLG